MRQLKQKAAEYDRLKDENTQMRAKLFKQRKLSEEIKAMQKDNDFLRSSLADQEDEMEKVLTKLEDATGGRIEVMYHIDIVTHNK